jgi:hypothetical protein
VNFTARLYIGGQTLLGLPSLARASPAAMVSIKLALRISEQVTCLCPRNTPNGRLR